MLVKLRVYIKRGFLKLLKKFHTDNFLKAHLSKATFLLILIKQKYNDGKLF